MRRVGLIVSCIVLGALVLTPASAHSLAELEAMLSNREKNFQPVDKDAPQFTMTGTDGRAISLADFRGKVVVLHFIVVNCRNECSRHVDRIAEIQSMVNQSPMKGQVQFVTIEIDPTEDSEGILTEFGRAHGLDPVNWVLLTTRHDQADDTTRKLAVQFGHRFEKTEDGRQIERVVTHVIDKNGRWRADFQGLKFELTNLVVFVNALVNNITRPHEEPNTGPWQRLKRWF